MFNMPRDCSSNVSKHATFTEINLAEIRREKLPKRLVYFSDGVLEEYSSDEELAGDATDTQPLIDPKTLSWIPYAGYLVWWLGSRTLSVCDYLGENLAWFFGITTPKFQYEIEQFEKMAKEEEERKQHIASEMAGWNAGDTPKKLDEAIEHQPHNLVFTSDMSIEETGMPTSTTTKMPDSTTNTAESC